MPCLFVKLKSAILNMNVYIKLREQRLVCLGSPLWYKRTTPKFIPSFYSSFNSIRLVRNTIIQSFHHIKQLEIQINNSLKY